MPENISSFGGQIDDLAVLITVLVGIGFVLAEAALFYAIFAFRERPGGAKRAQYITGETWRQARWILIPVLVVVAADFFIDVKTHGAWEEIKGGLPASTDYTVRITGQQFSWVFTYPDSDGKFGTAGELQRFGELRVPVDKTIRFHLEAKDVLHSFWVPTLRLKQDAVPGRTIAGWFRATKTGEFEIMCAEICGVGHTAMQAKLVVMNAEDFARWRANPNASGSADADGGDGLSPAARQGARLVKEKGCVACHSLDGSRAVGPSYRGIFGRSTAVMAGGQERQAVADEAYLRRAILEPQSEVVKGFQPVMPPQRANLTDDDVSAIIEYLKTVTEEQ